MCEVSGAFVVLGAFHSKYNNKANELYGEGLIGWVSRLMELGQVTEQHWAVFQHSNPEGTDFVWDYDISEGVGAFVAEYMATNGTFPTSADVSKRIRVLLARLGYLL